MRAVLKGVLALGLMVSAATFACAEPADPAVSATQPAVASLPAATAEPATEPIKGTRLEAGVASSAVMTAEDRHLEARKTDFLKFAEKKLKDMNRNHILSRERMRIEKRPDGSYKASFHQLDDSTLTCQVSRSPSKGAQYVAVLSYKEQVYTASCRTPADCRQGEFSPAEVIPNRHIFVYNKGVWQ